jgi:hypothetical protein
VWSVESKSKCVGKRSERWVIAYGCLISMF